MNKKQYTKPEIAKVKLEVREAVLGVCRVSGVTGGAKTGNADCKMGIPGVRCMT